MKTSFLLIATSLLAGTAVTQAASILRITEVMSSSSATADWFELTNYGDTAADLSGFKMDDNSFSTTLAVALSGITSIAAGQSVIFIEGDATAISEFQTAWANLTTPVGSYSGSGVGLAAGGDGLVIFDGANAEINRVTFGAATQGSSFYWTHDSSGALTSAAAGTLSTVAGPSSQFGTPGSVIPEPSTLGLAALGAIGLLRRRR